MILITVMTQAIATVTARKVYSYGLWQSVKGQLALTSLRQTVSTQRFPFGKRYGNILNTSLAATAAASLLRDHNQQPTTAANQQSTTWSDDNND